MSEDKTRKAEALERIADKLEAGDGGLGRVTT